MLTEKERAEFVARLELEGVEFARSRDGDFAGRCESIDKRLVHALANCAGVDRLALMAARVRLADLADDLPRRMTREERATVETIRGYDPGTRDAEDAARLLAILDRVAPKGE